MHNIVGGHTAEIVESTSVVEFLGKRTHARLVKAMRVLQYIHCDTK